MMGRQKQQGNFFKIWMYGVWENLHESNLTYPLMEELSIHWE